MRFFLDRMNKINRTIFRMHSKIIRFILSKKDPGRIDKFPLCPLCPLWLNLLHCHEKTYCTFMSFVDKNSAIKATS